MRQPPGFEVEGREDWVCRLKVSLYGTRQGGSDWNSELDSFMVDSQGWTRVSHDIAVYFKEWENNDWAIVGYWVDDGTGVGSESRLLELEKAIDARYGISSAGELSWLLGMRITRDRSAKTISLSQSAYIDSLVTRFGLDNATPAATPFVQGVALTRDQCPANDDEVREMANVPYRELVGSLMYLRVATRPDISYHVSVLSKFLNNPGRAHWEAAKRVLRFLKGSRDWKLTLGGFSDLVAYSDADWAGDRDDRKSTGGYVFLVGRGAVSWSSKRQPTVALSSLEAEYMALTQAAKEAIWIKSYLADIDVHVHGPVTVFGDNQGSLALAKNPVFHARTKHIDIQHHFIRDCVASGTIFVDYISTHDMLADGLTKPLSRDKHLRFAYELGLTDA